MSAFRRFPAPLWISLALAATASASSRPNILVIVLDDVGLDKLSMYGHVPVQGSTWGNERAAILPNLERLAARGVRFDHAYATPLCTPTRAQMLSGGYGHQTGVLSLRASLPVQGVPGSDGLLPSVLKQSGYRTGAFGKWHLAEPFDQPSHVFECGFDVFKGHMKNNQFTSLDANGAPPVGSIDHYGWPYVVVDALPLNSIPMSTCPAPTEFTQWTWDAGQTCDDARAFIERFAATPTRGDQHGNSWFAYVSINAPHQTWQLPPRHSISAEALAAIKEFNGWTAAALGDEAATDAAYDLETGFGLGIAPQSPNPTPVGCSSDTAAGFQARLYYRAMLESVDFHIGRLLGSTSDSVTDLENTLILVIGDNGTPAHAMQTISVSAPPTAAELAGAPYPRDHGKRWTYELGIGVPLLAYGPENIVGRGVSAGMVSTVDFWSTLTELAHVTVTSPPVHSISFAQHLIDPTRLTPSSTPQREFVYQEVGLQAGNNQCWDGRRWFACDDPTRSVIPSPRYRAVVHSSGWKFLLKQAPSDCGGVDCGPVCSLGPLPPQVSQVGCTSSAGDYHEFYRVFGAGLVVQPNELVYQLPPPKMQRALRCEMYRINGR